MTIQPPAGPGKTYPRSGRTRIVVAGTAMTAAAILTFLHWIVDHG